MYQYLIDYWGMVPNSAHDNDVHVTLWIESADAVHLVRQRDAIGVSTADVRCVGPHELSSMQIQQEFPSKRVSEGWRGRENISNSES